MKNLQVSECILKSTRCPTGSQCRPVKTDPFPKQGTGLKKTRPFPTVKHLRHCRNKHEYIIMFQFVCRDPFLSCANIGTFLVLTKQKVGSGYERLIIFTIAKEN